MTLKNDVPGSYLAIDPGRRMGWAHCLRGGDELQFGTWKFKHELAGAAYSAFLGNLKSKYDVLPDLQVGIELMTIVGHEDERGNTAIDAQQVEFSAGWPTHAKTLSYRMDRRPPEMIAISSWRSKTHGKTRAPDGYKGDKRKYLKQKAIDYCHANGWEAANDEEAEAICMLVYMRILYEPDFAFERGHSFQQEALF
jgi:hypothetical protein